MKTAFYPVIAGDSVATARMQFVDAKFPIATSLPGLALAASPNYLFPIS